MRLIIKYALAATFPPANPTPTPNFARTDVPVVEAVVLVNRRVRVGDNQWEDAEPTRYRIKAWRQLAQNIATLPKGAEVLVIGHIETEPYLVDGHKRTSDVLMVEAIGASLAHATVAITKNNIADPCRSRVSPEPSRPPAPVTYKSGMQ